MNTLEKIFSIAAVLFEILLIAFFLLWPEYQRVSVLLPASLFGLLVNTGLLFLVFRDIFLRTFNKRNAKIFWVVIILLFWPASVAYLALHGFHRR